MQNLNYLMLYATLGAPFLIVLLDTIAQYKDADRKRQLLGFAAVLSAIIPLYTYYRPNSKGWLFLLVPGALALIYSRNMQGLGKHLILGWWLALCSHSIGGLLLQSNLPHYSYYGEALMLPAALAFFVIPPLLIWHLWHNLPLAFDAARGGNWRETGVPLLAKYRFLAVIVLVSLAANVFLLIQGAGYKDTIYHQTHSEQYGMWFDLRCLNHLFTYHDSDAFTDWERSALDYINSYASQARRLPALLRIHSFDTKGGLYFFILTLPEGLQKAVEEKESLKASDIASLNAAIELAQAAIEKAQTAIEKNRRGHPRQIQSIYKDAADSIIPELIKSSAIRFFDLQYAP